jgi:hypothetical protein
LPSLTIAPENKIISVFKTSTMNIGTVNPISGRILNANVFSTSEGSLPSFVTFANPILTFNSPGYAQIGVYNLEIKVGDSISSQVFPFTLTVKNDPPVFIQPPPVRIEAYSGVNT